MGVLKVPASAAWLDVWIFPFPSTGAVSLTLLDNSAIWNVADLMSLIEGTHTKSLASKDAVSPTGCKSQASKKC